MSTATFANHQQDIAAEYIFFQELWASITDWNVDTRYQQTKFAELCMMQGKKFGLWDALHRSMGYFDGRMTIAYRLIRPLLTEYFRALDHVPNQIYSALRTAYLFMVSPQDQRDVVTDYLLEMGRWIAEVRPTLVLQSTSALIDAMQQEFVPPQKRSWQLQRWAAMVGATGLSLMSGEDDSVVREAAAYFEVLHVTLWELVALASTVVTIQYQASLTPTGRTVRDVSSAPYRTGVHTMHFALVPYVMVSSAPYRTGVHTMHFAQSVLATSSSGDVLSSSTPYDGGLAADYIPEARLALNKKVAWDDVQPVWAAPNGPKSNDMCGLVFTEHMHSLVMALSIYSQICPNVKERGIICLANLIRTLLKSKHSGSQLATNAAICLKLLKFPTMSGLNTMPLHALLGLQVLRDSRGGGTGGRPGPSTVDPLTSAM
ncbi:Hypothetical protein, putative [Bodo saltans]|uniref:Uncharacterized protein n=1 Tax=Bodo saltans TaxID=75058 RepID=A0A0S4II18_BODSA|nr:Hypothetical protein, putative [Bodo saltans]|eukprot:CUE70417.1 Hypothetical protein, putative [Bodo saltans]